MKILLTGHKGFIGSHLLSRLSKENAVVGIDLEDGWDRDKYNNNQDLINCELNENFDLIIHLAGKSGVRESIDDPAGYWRNNVEVSKRLFARYPDTRILYASSSSAYEPDLNPYAASKFCVEEAAERYPNTLGMRFHTVYSDTPRKGMFLDKLINNKLEYVTRHYRDFIHIEDLCDAIELCMNSKYTGIIDIGTGAPFRVQDFAPDLPVRLNTPNERQWTCANMEKIKTLGFKPKYSIENYLTNDDKGNIIKLEIGETV
jgi:nucleoside-diphosphate-sugar epimerase